MTLKREGKKHEIECEVVTRTEIFFDDFSHLYFYFSFSLSTYLFEGEGGSKDNNPVQ
jgi:hypothetical protein